MGIGDRDYMKDFDDTQRTIKRLMGVAVGVYLFVIIAVVAVIVLAAIAIL